MLTCCWWVPLPRHPTAALGRILAHISLGQSSYRAGEGGWLCGQSSSAAARWTGLQVTLTGEQRHNPPEDMRCHNSSVHAHTPGNPLGLNSDLRHRNLPLTEVRRHLCCRFLNFALSFFTHTTSTGASKLAVKQAGIYRSLQDAVHCTGQSSAIFP